MRDPRLYQGFQAPHPAIAHHLDTLMQARAEQLNQLCTTAFLLQAGEFVDHLILATQRTAAAATRIEPTVASRIACPPSCPFTHTPSPR